MKITDEEIIGKLKFMAMDTKLSGSDRAFFREVADRFNENAISSSVHRRVSERSMVLVDAVNAAVSEFTDY